MRSEANVIGEATHYGLNVSDMDEALRFYNELLGFEIDRRFSISDAQSDIVGVAGVEGDIAFLNAGEFLIELVDYEAPENENVHETSSGHDVGIAHLCIEVDDVRERYEELAAESTFVSEPKVVGDGLRITYMRDPDGNYVELMETPAEA